MRKCLQFGMKTMIVLLLWHLENSGADISPPLHSHLGLPLSLLSLLHVFHRLCNMVEDNTLPPPLLPSSQKPSLTVTVADLTFVVTRGYINVIYTLFLVLVLICIFLV